MLVTSDLSEICQAGFLNLSKNSASFKILFSQDAIDKIFRKILINSLQEKISLHDNKHPNYLLDDRLKRWLFALDIYLNDFTVLQKFIGRGFDYIPAYGNAFFNDSGRTDYPHNPLLSTLLYSGITGLTIYLLFLIQSLILYFRFIRYHLIFFVFYILTIFYVFFSCNSHFDLPIFTFLSIIPFITRYIVKKEQEKTVL